MIKNFRNAGVDSKSYVIIGIKNWIGSCRLA